MTHGERSGSARRRAVWTALLLTGLAKTARAAEVSGPKAAAPPRAATSAQTPGSIQKEGAPATTTPSLPAAAASAGALFDDAGRLLGDVVPWHYDAAVSANPEGGVFAGRSRIFVNVAKPVRSITLHALELNISRAVVSGQRLSAGSLLFDKKNETVTLDLGRELPAGQAVLEFDFSGQLNRHMKGLYRSTAKVDGKLEHYAFTQFEATDARRMMPAFDEPALKATFQLRVTAPAGLTVVSNMPEVKRAVHGNRQTVTFGKTPVMSTYLLAVAAARLASVVGKVGDTLIRVMALPEQLKQVRFALRAAKRSVSWLNSYFDIPYPLPKLDLVAAPDFQAGAMENFGAMFFRDSAVRVDPAQASARALRRVAVVVAHEIVHQWFGNLVTMKWWNNLWLNEAFAEWLSHKLVDRWMPGWKIWHDFERGKRVALALDALGHTRPIASPASSSAEIEAMFDPVTYQKGSAVLRMLESWVGESAFREGLRLYMRKHAYANAEDSDLWSAIEQASGLPVADVARGWLSQPGFPIVSASRVGPRELELSQRRFAAGSDDQQLWKIPLVIRYRLQGESSVRERRVLLSEREQKLTLPGRGDLAWVYVNGGETGYYRAALDGGLVSAALAHAPELSEVERSGLLGDLFARARQGDVPVERALDALAALSSDDSQMVVEDIAHELVSAYRALPTGDRERKSFARQARALLEPQRRRLGWDARPGDGDDAKLARAAVYDAVSQLEPSADFKRQARRRAQAYLKDPAAIDPSMAATVLAAAARSGDASLFDRYVAAMSLATTPEERDRMLAALPAFGSPELATRLMEMTLADAIRPQDAWKPYGALLTNPRTQAAAWNFLQTRWTDVRARLGERGAARIIAGLGSLKGADQRGRAAAFFAEPANAVEMAKRNLKQALEQIDISERYKTSQRTSFLLWLSHRHRRR